MADRPAQCWPVSALSGHSAGMAVPARLTDRLGELGEDDRAELDRRLGLLLEHSRGRPEVTVIWFQPDERKEGGMYRTTTGCLKRHRELERTLLLEDGTEIPRGDIVGLESSCFHGKMQRE